MVTPRSHLAGYLESLPEPHILCDASYRIVAANADYRQRFGQVRHSVWSKGANFTRCVNPCTADSNR